jgi:hypothetical protein
MWLRIKTSEVALVNTVMNIRVEILEGLAASQEGLRCMKLVPWLAAEKKVF